MPQSLDDDTFTMIKIVTEKHQSYEIDDVEYAGQMSLIMGTYNLSVMCKKLLDTTKHHC